MVAHYLPSSTCHPDLRISHGTIAMVVTATDTAMDIKAYCHMILHIAHE